MRVRRRFTRPRLRWFRSKWEWIVDTFEVEGEFDDTLANTGNGKRKPQTYDPRNLLISVASVLSHWR